jgi:uncharacterized protein
VSAAKKQGFFSKYGPWALIAGSAQGMGEAYAEAFAGNGLNLVLLDRDGKALESQRKRMARKHAVQVRALQCDLADTPAIEGILDQLEELEIGMLVFNAAAADTGAWLDVPLQRKRMVVSVNVLTPLLMVDRLSRQMAARGRGGIILTSSMSALQGAPRQGVYAATKAFDLILGETLWAELRAHGVDVLAFIPGMVRTPAFERTGASQSASALMPPLEPAQAVAEALAALGRHPSWIPGRVWRIAALATSKLLPRRLAIAAVGERMKQLGRD